MSFTFLVGGARSGKSSLALSMVQQSELPVTFVATGEARDSEFAMRIERHRSERPASWTTIEEPVALEEVFSNLEMDQAVILDCLTLWVANLLERNNTPDDIEKRAESLALVISEMPGPVVVVSNEVGSGIVPGDALSRLYRDVLGRTNAIFARSAESAYLVVAGRGLLLEDLEPAIPQSHRQIHLESPRDGTLQGQQHS